MAYSNRVQRLALLAPEISEAILDGRQPAGMTLAVLIRPVAVGGGGSRWRRLVLKESGPWRLHSLIDGLRNLGQRRQTRSR